MHFRKCLLTNFSCLRSNLMQKYYLTSNSDNSVKLAYINVRENNCDSSVNPIFIYHGLFGSKNNWRSISRALSKQTTRSVYSFDLRNHGESPHTDGHQTDLLSMANDIKLFMDDNQFSEACIIGHSLGGRIAMQFAFAYPERVEKLVAVDIGPKGTIPNAFFLRPTFTDKLSDAIRDIPPNVNLSEARNIVNERLQTDISDAFIRGFFLMSLDADKSGKIRWKYNLEGIKVMLENRVLQNITINQPFMGKTLLIHGQNSDYVKKSDYDSIVEVLPNAKIIEIPETGHYLHIEKPNEVISNLVAFINS